LSPQASTGDANTLLEDFQQRQYSVSPICGGAFNPLSEFTHFLVAFRTRINY